MLLFYYKHMLDLPLRSPLSYSHFQEVVTWYSYGFKMLKFFGPTDHHDELQEIFDLSMSMMVLNTLVRRYAHRRVEVLSRLVLKSAEILEEHHGFNIL